MKNKEEKFNNIILENSLKIKRICNYYSANTEDKKDMYQEILINIWNSLDSFRGDASISTWIYRIAVNTSLGFVGKAFKNMKLIVNKTDDNFFMLFEDSLNEKLLKEEQLNNLQIELNQLSVIDKSLMSLMLEGITMREIAEIIGITEPNVKVKINRIKKNLRIKLLGGKK